MSLALLSGASGISKVYLDAHVRKPAFGQELLTMSGFVLQVAVVIVELVDELLPTLDKKDPTFAKRMEGFERMKRGLAEIVKGSLMLLQDTATLGTPARAAFAETLAGTLPKIAKQLPPLTKTEFKKTLRARAKAESDPSIKAALLKATRF